MPTERIMPDGSALLWRGERGPWSGKTAEARFWARVDRRGPDDDWRWTGSKSWGGYGYFQVGGVRMGAHVFSYLLHHGPVPAGCDVCHHCDVPPCVNPAHLYVATHQVNHLDSALRGRRGRQPGIPRAEYATILALADAGYSTREITQITDRDEHLVVHLLRHRHTLAPHE